MVESHPGGNVLGCALRVEKAANLAAADGSCPARGDVLFANTLLLLLLLLLLPYLASAPPVLLLVVD